MMASDSCRNGVPDILVSSFGMSRKKDIDKALLFLWQMGDKSLGTSMGHT